MVARAQPNCIVIAVFSRMFRDGLIYRGPQIVNWDPHLQTTVSDDEIDYQDRQAKFYTMRYGPFLAGTSRPETKLGDTAIAVHPDDERYREHVGKTYDIAWPKGPTITVRVVADESVDPETGTGALGVTPAHSQVDFEIAQRHGLPLVPGRRRRRPYDGGGGRALRRHNGRRVSADTLLSCVGACLLTLAVLHVLGSRCRTRCS